MLFSSSIFLFLFLPIVLIVYYNPFIKKRTFRNIVLFLASVFFYAWGEPLYVWLMLVSIVVNWWFGILLEKVSNRKLIIWCSVIYNIGILFVFKYVTFIAQQLGLLLNRNFSEVSIAMPIGISFFTFQMLSYVLDVYYGKAKTQKNVLYVGLYVSMFPQLIAGPIVRYDTVVYEIEHRRENFTDITEGLYRFILGLGKKVIVSNSMGSMADVAFNNVGDLSVCFAWLGAIAYTFQIYFDFSGYSDMAIGLGRMFGFHFLENFNYPYIAKSITEFWRRWHISLSSWFRDYVYIPLGGNRVTKRKWVRNIFVVWLLTGIWHGANWTFVLWGFIYFVCLLAEKYTGITQYQSNNILIRMLQHLYTMVIVIIAWVLFRAESLGEFWCYLQHMLAIHTNMFMDEQFVTRFLGAIPILIIAILGCMPIKKIFTKYMNTAVVQILYAVYCIIVFIISVCIILNTSYNPFIYFNF